ncbi:MAG: hypothetical protein FWE23_08905 [Chitinivibrionia bacterium]|nr:hypothetical protein [Chitinivibrionia bacterium]
MTIKEIVKAEKNTREMFSKRYNKKHKGVSVLDIPKYTDLLNSKPQAPTRRVYFAYNAKEKTLSIYDSDDNEVCFFPIHHRVIEEMIEADNMLDFLKKRIIPYCDYAPMKI